MHAYSTDESRVAMYASLAVVAVVLAWLVVVVTSALSWPQWLISAPSMAGAFVFVYGLFDRFLWRSPILRKVGAVRVGDVAGVYRGALVSTYRDEEGNPISRDVCLTVRQTWTRISIEMTVTSGSSSSVSTSALGSVTSDGVVSCLTYVYRNRVNPGLADADMGDHDGAADLRIYPDGRMAGRYFNSRPRAGTIQASRVT